MFEVVLATIVVTVVVTAGIVKVARWLTDLYINW